MGAFLRAASTCIVTGVLQNITSIQKYVKMVAAVVFALTCCVLPCTLRHYVKHLFARYFMRLNCRMVPTRKSRARPNFHFIGGMSFIHASFWKGQPEQPLLSYFPTLVNYLLSSFTEYLTPSPLL